MQFSELETTVQRLQEERDELLAALHARDLELAELRNRLQDAELGLLAATLGGAQGQAPRFGGLAAL